MSQDEIVRYYSARAPEYDRSYEKPERQKDLTLLRGILPPLLEGRDVLEIACGTGYWTEIIAPAAASVVAADVSPTVLEIAKRRSYPSGRVSFLEADAYRLENLPGRFSACLAAFFWSHVPLRRLPGFLEGLHRRLGISTRVVFLDNIYVEGSSTPIGRRDGDGNTYQRRVLEDGSQWEVVKNFPDEAELRLAVGSSGRNLRIERLTYYWCLSYEIAQGIASRSSYRQGEIG
jgi:demethylmenaquinone methyltransferase/2-methoxy-6-polyprenyl-1,4-benzoquinol methylase